MHRPGGETESLDQVKQALAAQSHTASLEELRSRGRDRVRLIRPEQIASMIETSVQRAIEASGALPPEQVEALVEASRDEFKAQMAETKAKADELQAASDQLAAAKIELAAATEQRDTTQTELAGERERAEQLRTRIVELEAEVERLEQRVAEADDADERVADAETRATEAQERATAAEARAVTLEQELSTLTDAGSADLDQARVENGNLTTALAAAEQRLQELDAQAERLLQLERDLAAAQQRAETAEAAAEQERQRAAEQPQQAGPDVAAQSALMMQLMNEVASLRVDTARQQPATAPAAPQQGAAGDGQFNDAIDQLTGAINQRLDQFGKKMGISAAVDAADVDYSGLIAAQDKASAGMESNIEAVEVTKKKGGGIAGNLERLKKLKGGG